MQNVYRKGDPTSSPFDPAMGDIVIYRDRRRGLTAAETFPAIITKAHPNDRCDLTVFTPFGVRHIMNIGFNSNMDGENCWFWPAPKVERKAVDVVVIDEVVEMDNKDAKALENLDPKIKAAVSGSGSAKPVDKSAKAVQAAKA